MNEIMKPGTDREELCREMAEMLPEVRRLLGVSQSGLAEMTGVSRQTITNCERGATPMHWTLFLAVFMICLEDQQTREYLKMTGWTKEGIREAIHGSQPEKGRNH